MEAQKNMKKIEEFLKTDAHKPTVPRVTDGSRSPRRVDKIDGERVEGLSTIGWLRFAPMASMASMVDGGVGGTRGR